ncbi:MAG: hypothetical protein ABJB01_01795 [Rudaea sp.]
MTIPAPNRRLPNASRARTIAVLGAIVWPSFVAAAIATMVCFAIFDPVDLADVSWPQFLISRQLGYAIGFFMFWFCTLASSAFTALLLFDPKKGVATQSDFADLP